MAALNKTETENLRRVMALLSYIQKNGYDPKKDTDLTNGLKNGQTIINTVVQMKGYYPK